MELPSLGRILIVGLGGFIGAAARFVLGVGVQRLSGGEEFPYGTLFVNMLGCLLIGFLGGLTDQGTLASPGWRLFLMTGLLGGFTTYSAFAFDTISLAQATAVARAILNVVGHVVVGLLAAWLGYFAAQQL